MSVVKITLPLGEIPVNGKQVSFAAPCDCDKVTGLSIEGETYTVCDAMGRTATGIGGVFCAGSIVSVILSVTEKKAFIQNPAFPAAQIWTFDLEDGNTITKPVYVPIMDFSILKNPVISEGAVEKITDANGEVLWACWPDDLDTGLEFVSASAFTLNVSSPKWDGTMEYCNGGKWKTWDGSAIASTKTESGQRVYIRGIGNTKVTGGSAGKWGLNGTDIECNGNIENLLDYETVAAGEHPTMAVSCFAYMFYKCISLTTAPSLPATTLAESCCSYMFYDCRNLTTAPSLPATTLAESCYMNMFYNCINLTTAPSLPATTLAESCYAQMFYNCSKLTTVPSLPAATLAEYCYKNMFSNCSAIKLSSEQIDTYTIPYRVPDRDSGLGTTASGALTGMFTGTGGTYRGSISINITYFLDESNTIV